MFEEKQEYVSTVLPNGCIEVRRTDIVLKDGIAISRNHVRHVLTPGQSLNNENPVVASIANAVWTPEVIAAWEVKQANATT